MVRHFKHWLFGRNQQRLRHFLLCAGLILVVSSAPVPAASTLSSETDTVDVIGVLQREVVPGPPNYEDLGAGDRPETVWFITVLEQESAPGSARVAGKRTGPVLERIQLLLPEDHYSNLLNQRVVVSGTLFDAHTIHHRTPVLMFVTKLRTF